MRGGGGGDGLMGQGAGRRVLKWSGVPGLVGGSSGVGVVGGRSHWHPTPQAKDWATEFQPLAQGPIPTAGSMWGLFIS